ncbi:MAG: ribosome recycling factor [Leptospiraceae bacterium]|nr:ribosome recycling factor [Leptospiraceae bacterium]MBK7056242.1 ribosome recycling factor [Leptospiraceae bacterium]MBK9501494.1 ribosome recycling factor [Leptospiraceae bacterium]MBL0266385.1 ribosome recycling factor [Leptospiraceae bacterium]HRG45495.1 ribosome recycling factor [Leptospiraceae bacterium]
MTDYVSQAKVKMDKTIDALKKDFLQIRTGRANPAMVEDIKVEYYGALTPLNQMGSITTPEPRLIMITPYDKTVIKNIEKAIMTSGMGFSPNNDGVVVRIPLPELTGDRRKELVKVLKQKSEEKKVAIRNIRRDINDDIKKDNSEASQDQIKGLTDQIQKLTDSYISKIQEMTDLKEKEVTTV